ncbi:flagellar hook-basal body complex protein FliE [Roseospirillum parvum]|uniref:Flagellar hook-basal body complex protein FliE n=1 Tax=Roseospirillum parvum TaxID=83401 RepID=A0A1G8DIB7_9PROT|nr:flagellar hook-basal body complex protein FliE [Roseospirillum parvum]SDH57100.1 flagellar hook-basal body complex protein FliE [Roseospirillum parvum]
MAVNMNGGVAAYQAAARMGPKPGGGAAPAGNAVDTFAGLVKDSLKEAVAIGRHSEEMTKQAIKGEADLREVVLAVNNAENALDTVVKVRDKVLKSYQEILKMPI